MTQLIETVPNFGIIADGTYSGKMGGRRVDIDGFEGIGIALKYGVRSFDIPVEIIATKKECKIYYKDINENR